MSQPVPLQDGPVTDKAGLLSPETVKSINAQLLRLEKEDSTQVAVLIIPTLGDSDLEQYSLKVAKTWGVGHQQLDNGVLLFIAVQNRQIRIEVGYGLENALTDLVSGRIIRTFIVPEFREGNFDEGVKNGVEAIVRVVKGEYDAMSAADTDSKDRAGFFVAALCGLFFIGIIFRKHKKIAIVVGGAYGGFLGQLAPYTTNQQLSVLLFVCFCALGSGVTAAIIASRSRRARGVEKSQPGSYGHYHSENRPDHDSSGKRGGGDFGGGGASGEW